MRPTRTGLIETVTCFCLAAAGFANAQSSHSPPLNPPPHLERPDDPPAHFIGPRRVAPPPSCEFLTVNGFTSVQVNVDENGNNILDDAANEPTIAINPLDPDNIVIGWRQFDTIESGFRQSGVASSHDGGLTWTNRGPLQAGTFGSDPVLNVDAEGVFYYVGIGDGGVRLFRSFNDGAEWDPAILVGDFRDKEWFTVDRTDGIGRGHLYMTWSDSRNFTRSTDGGETWMTPIESPLRPSVLGTLSVGPEGELYIVDHRFRVARSDDAQDAERTPSFAQVTDVFLGGSLPSRDRPNPGGLLAQPWIKSDHSGGPTRGNVYLLCSVWVPGEDPCDVMFARSVDGGRTWADPIRVNDDPAVRDAWQWFGAMDVAPSGRIDAVWYDTRTSLEAALSEVFYAYSTNAGDTWSPNIQVAPVFDSTIGYPQHNKIGDYIGVISNKTANVAFAATYNGEQDVYFLSIEIDCNVNGVHDGDDIIAGRSDDCNANAVPDECEPDEDCNDNGIRDLCEPDCNENGVADECDIRDGTSDDCNENGVPDECLAVEGDCNENRVPDECDIDEGRSEDCNENGIPDECLEIEGDCNENRVPDECDIREGKSEDCNENGIPDECIDLENDCNQNHVPDACDIREGMSEDCNENGIPDECIDLENDCNQNHVPDECDIRDGTSEDCNENGIPDECIDLEDDCNQNRVPDECDIRDGTSEDCNENGIPDECSNIEEDCNENRVPDECDIRRGTSEDCNENGIPDECIDLEIDCNENRVPDECDIRRGTSEDCNKNGIPDECIDLEIDCNENHAPDECDIGRGTSEDCNENGVPDECDSKDELFKLLPDDGADGDRFGVSVAISGAVGIVGARGHDDNGSLSGSAYLFDVTTGQPIGELLADDGASGDAFGVSVAIDGSIALVGASGDGDNGFSSGSAYLFDITTREQIAKLLPSDGAQGDNFGRAVAISGDTALVGARVDDDNGSASGSAYLFDTATGQQIAKLLPSDGAEGDRFGVSVAISGETAVVGAYFDDDNGPDAGSAYLFHIPTGQQIAKLLPGDGAELDRFGVSVGISGTTAIVGASNDDDNGFDSGSAYLFDTATGQEIAKLLPFDGAGGDRFGVSVAIGGALAIVGADRDDDNGESSGAAYYFDTSTGRQIAKPLPGDGAPGDIFGASVGIGGTTAIVGAPGNNNNRIGAAYLFEPAHCEPCVRAPKWQCDGDVDGDGQVNPVDSGLVQAAFGSADEQDLCNYDLDCDGQINPVDSGIVQSLFGTCAAPRPVCP